MRKHYFTQEWLESQLGLLKLKEKKSDTVPNRMSKCRSTDSAGVPVHATGNTPRTKE